MRARSLILVTALALSAAACSSKPITPSASQTSRMAGAGRGDSGQGGGSDDSDATTARLNALAQAKADGRFGSDSQPIVTSPATGWAGEQVVNPKVDDWEPAVATDPHSGYAYILTTRYGTGPTCQAHCPTPYIALTVSSNNGATWGKQVPLWGVKGSNAQYDPTIEVVPSTGVVYACFLDADRHNGFSLLFIKSTDHGKTWGNPVRPNGRVSWTDKDFLTTSPSGKDVYVSWNGPTGGDLWMGVSHDYGATWTQTRVVDSKRYSYAYDAKVLPDGTVIFSESSFQYTCEGSGSFNCVSSGRIWHHAIISRDNGRTWHNQIVAKVLIGENCHSAGCGEFYTGQTSVATDANGNIVFAYEGPSTNHGPQTSYVKTSTDEGRTWSAPVALSVQDEDSTGPRLAGTGNGDFRVWYMQTARGDAMRPDGTHDWNVWYRSSNDGGATWSKPVKLDDAPVGAAGYIHARGFDEIYGDYGEIAITSTGKTIGVWGEGYSWNGPGGCWFNIQT